jgi:hypothetical protein
MRSRKTQPVTRKSTTIVEYRRCTHGTDTTVTVNPSPFRTNNETVIVRVCRRADCITDAMAWVERATGRKPVWMTEVGKPNRHRPRHDVLPSAAVTGRFAIEA